MEAKAIEWGLPDELTPALDKINALPYLNKAQKETLVEKCVVLMILRLHNLL